MAHVAVMKSGLSDLDKTATGELVPQLVTRWAKAIWESEVAAGNCITAWPLTKDMHDVFMRAAWAAYRETKL